MLTHEGQRERRDTLGLASFGFFLFLVGVIWVITPNLSEKVVDFFSDFKVEEALPSIFLPAPVHSHPIVYTAVGRFCLAFGLFQIIILVFRIFFRETVDMMAGTISSIVFWSGAGFLANMLSAEAIGWFATIWWLVVLIGLSLVVRSLIVLLFKLILRGH